MNLQHFNNLVKVRKAEMNLADFTALKESLEEYKAEISRAEGRLAQIYSDLKKEFGVESMEDAKELLIHLEQEEKKAAQEYEATKRDFEANYGPKLGQ